MVKYVVLLVSGQETRCPPMCLIWVFCPGKLEWISPVKNLLQEYMKHWVSL